MLKSDGSYTVFVIQFLSDRGVWHNCCVTEHESFLRSGDCWQQLGISGTFSEEEGKEDLGLMKQRAPNMKLRLVQRKIKQDTKVLIE